MPESASALLRRRLSPVEMNVLLLASRGGPQNVLVELGGQLGLKSREDAADKIAAVKAKAELIMATGGVEDTSTGREVKCDCGAMYVPRAGDKGKCPACRMLVGGTEGGGARPKPAADKPAAIKVPVPEMPPAKRRRSKPKADPPKRRPRDATHSNGNGAHSPEEAARRLSVAELREVEQRGRDEQAAHRRDQETRLGDGLDGWPHTAGVIRRQVVVDDDELPGAVKRRREGAPARGSILAEPAGTDPAAAKDGASVGGQSMTTMKAQADARRERIVEMLADGPRTAKALQMALGVSDHSVRDDLDRLCEAERVERAEGYGWDWPGAPAEGERKGKPSRLWRLWTGNGAPSESQASLAAAARAAEEPEPPAEPEFDHEAEFEAAERTQDVVLAGPAKAQETVIRGDVLAGVPRDPVELHFAYARLLFDIAKDAPTEQHVFDRIERILKEGPPNGESRAS